MTDAPAVAAVDATAAAPPRKRRWRRRIVLAVVTVLAFAALILLAIGLGGHAGLDPDSTAPEGGAAVTQLLRNHGATVRVERGARPVASLAGTTVVVSGAENVAAADLDALAALRPARIVVLVSGSTDANGLGLLARAVKPQPTAASCPDPVAGRARSVTSQWVLSGATAGDRQCFASAVGAPYVVLHRGGVEVHVLAGVAHNASLADDGNASLALGVMGTTPSVLWWIASPGGQDSTTAPGTGRDRLPSFLPDWALWTLVPLFAGCVVVAVWRGRRLGPILSERLPVVVRASETVEGHGRMYHRLSARDTAAENLRRGTISRLERRFGTDDPARLAELVGARTGRPVRDVQQVLAGGAPSTDLDLITLKHNLDTLEQEAKQP